MSDRSKVPPSSHDPIMIGLRRKARCKRQNERPQTQSASNPFKKSDEDRNHFPGLDDFLLAKTKPAPKRPIREIAPKHRLDVGHNVSSSALNPSRKQQSVCSYSSPLNISADFSIGALAAITEHRRDIELFGFDGIAPKVKEKSLSQSEMVWDRIMAGDGSCASLSTFVEDDSNAVPASDALDFRDDFQESDLNNTTDSDFFNSVRVNCLMTPERNKSKVDEASRLARIGKGEVTERKNYEISFTGSVSGSESGSIECSEPGMSYLFNNACCLEREGDQISSCGDSSPVTSEDALLFIQGEYHKNNAWNKAPPYENKRRKNSSPVIILHEEDCGIELVADVSDISTHNFGYNTPLKSVSQPNQDSDYPCKSPTPKSEHLSMEQENLNLGFLALSPITSQAGSIATKIIQTSGLDFYNERKTRLPLSAIVASPNGKQFPPRATSSLMRQSRRNWSPSLHLKSRSDLISPSTIQRDKSFQYHGAVEISDATFSEDLRVERKPYKNGGQAVNSLKKRYSQPDRFEDSFSSHYL